VVYQGTVQGNRIELDERLPLEEGTRVTVEVSVEGKLRRGSPRSLLRLAGTLTPEEAEAILEATQVCRKIDASLWSSEQ